jgi:glycosyltransferase involved in cell wall biosynthesis
MKSSEYRVLWIDVVSEMGGAQHSLFEVCRALASDGVDIEAALPPGPLSDKCRDAGLKVYPISPIRASRKGLALFTTAAKLLRSPHTVSQIVRVCKPDIVHANSLAAFMTTRHVPSSVPVLWHVRDIQSDPHLIRSSVRRADGIITASEAIDISLTDIISPRHRDKLHLVRNGIDPAIFEGADKSRLRAANTLPESAPLIGMAAHIVPWKKHDVFIECAALIKAHIPDAHFALIGRDLFNENRRYLRQLKDLVAARKLEECFHWIDNRTAPEEILPALDLLIHPPKREPFGRVVCEAMACGVPVVVADTGGPALIVADRTSGRLAKDGAAENFAEIAVELLRHPETCRTLAANARERVLESFTVARVGRDLQNVYQTTLQRFREAREYRPDRD